MTSERGGRPAVPLAFLGGLAVLSGGHIISKVLTFFVFAALARALDRDGYGAVEYLGGLALLFATAVESGLGAVGVRRIARHPGDVAGLAAQIPVARLALAVFSVPALVLVASSARLRPDTQGLAWLFALSLLPAAWRQDWLLQATGRLGQAALAQTLRTIVFAVMVLTLVRDSRDLLLVGWAELAGVTAMAVYTLAVQQARITPCRLTAPAGDLLALVKEGALLSLGNVVWAANQYAPVLLVATLVGTEETAWLAAASRVIGSLLTFSYVYFFGLYPAIARETMSDRAELAQVLAASFRVAAWSATLVAVTLTLLATPLMVLAFGARFAHAGSLVALMAWVLPVSLLSGHARWSLVAAGAQFRVVLAQLAGTVALIALGVPLVLALGGLGAALAAVVSAVAVWLVSHALAADAGVRLPSFTLALGPGLLALGVLVGARALTLHGWSAAVGVLVFATAAPLIDRSLLPAVARLGATRPGTAGSPDVAA